MLLQSPQKERYEKDFFDLTFFEEQNYVPMRI